MERGAANVPQHIREGLRVIENGERSRSGRAWPLAGPPALPPGATPVHPRHELLDGIVPLAGLQFQCRLCARLRGHGDVPSTALEDQAEIGLGRDLQPYPAWSKVGESLLERLARRQFCGGLVTHTLSSSCLRLWGNSPHSLVSQRLPLHWGLRAHPTSTRSVGSSMAGAERGST